MLMTSEVQDEPPPSKIFPIEPGAQIFVCFFGHGKATKNDAQNLESCGLW
jgi:hypothetical protein